MATTPVTALNSSLNIDISALAASAGIPIGPGTYTYSIGIGNIVLGFENAAKTGISGPLPSNASGKGITGTFIVK